MKVRFVSHASFSVESKGTTLLTDPWLVGKVFNNGWRLVGPPAPVPLEKVDYFWISHQHPDHLNFPTLKSIPPRERGRIAVPFEACAPLAQTALDWLNGIVAAVDPKLWSVR